MKKRFLVLGLVLGLVLIFTSACGPKQSANTDGEQKQVIKLKVADSLPKTNNISKYGIVEWMKRVEELTAGKVKFEHFPAEQMGKAKDMLELTRSGTADLAYVASSYVAAGMDMSGVIELPNAFPSSEIASQVYWKLSQGAMQNTDFLKNGIRPVLAMALPPYDFYNTKREVKVPDDVKGMKTRSQGGVMNTTIQSFGGIPVVVAAPELYESLQKGVVDGAVLPVTSLSPYKAEELVKYVTRDVRLGTFCATLSINEKVWQSLPQDVQKAMLKAGDETSKSFGKENDDQVEKLFKGFAEKNGLKIYTPNPDEKKKWQQATFTVEQKWVKDMTAKGLSAQQVLDERKKITEQLTGGK